MMRSGIKRKTTTKGAPSATVSEAARFWASRAASVSPRAISIDISLSRTELVAMTMTPPGN